MGHNPYYINALAQSCIFSLLSASNRFIIFWLVYIVFGMHGICVSVCRHICVCMCMCLWRQEVGLGTFLPWLSAY